MSRPADPGRDRSGALPRLGWLPWLVVAPLFLAPFGAALAAGTAVDGGSGSWTGFLSSTAVRASLGFSAAQASISTLACLALGLPGAWLLARCRFAGRRWYRALASLALVFPPVLFSLGFVGAWGNNGFVNQLLMAVSGSAEPPLRLAYSFGGVVAAHALLNFPLVSGLVAPVWRRLPRSTADAARLLGAGEGRVFLTVTLPGLLPGVAAAASLVFLYCFMSFAIPLTLGGGPAMATLEVSIYAAVSGGNDFARAGGLAALEAGCSLCILAAYVWLNARASRAADGAPAALRPLRSLPFPVRLAARLWLVGSSALALSPLAALAASSLAAADGGPAYRWSLEAWRKLWRDPANLQAMGDSLLVAAAAAALALAIACLLLAGEGRSGARPLRAVFFGLPLALSSVMLSLGYLVLFPTGANVAALVAVQACAAYPVAWRGLAAVRGRIPRQLDEAAQLLGAGRTRIAATIDVPLLRPVLLSSFALAFAVSLGEINAALLLTPNGFPLLSVRAYRLMGSYQFPVAAAIGVMVCALALFAVAASARWGAAASGEE